MNANIDASGTERGFMPAPEVVVTDLGDDLVLLNSRSGEMFALNEAGRCIWYALGGGQAAAAAALIDAFDVTPERARADVRALVNELVEAGLVPADRDGA